MMDATQTGTAVTTPTTIESLQVGMEVKGKVKRIELYGAFVDIGVNVDGLLHISQLGQRNVRNVEDVIKVDEEINVYVLRVEPAQRRIALSMEKPAGTAWEDLKEGQIITGKVIRIENFGAFIDIGAERPGMIHVSELANGYVNSPADVVKVGQEVRAQVIKVNKKDRRIDLSIKALEASPKVEKMPEEPEEYVPTAMELAIQRAQKNAVGDAEMASEGRSVRRKEERRTGGGKNRDRRDMEDVYERTLRGKN